MRASVDDAMSEGDSTVSNDDDEYATSEVWQSTPEESVGLGSASEAAAMESKLSREVKGSGNESLSLDCDSVSDA